MLSSETNALDDNILKTLLLRKLPSSVLLTLWARPDLALPELVELADRLVQIFPLQTKTGQSPAVNAATLARSSRK